MNSEQKRIACQMGISEESMKKAKAILHRPLPKRLPMWWTDSENLIAQALTAEYERGIEESVRVAESLKFGGDYTDCPAAWINSCYDKFVKAIRQLKG